MVGEVAAIKVSSGIPPPPGEREEYIYVPPPSLQSQSAGKVQQFNGQQQTSAGNGAAIH